MRERKGHKKMKVTYFNVAQKIISSEERKYTHKHVHKHVHTYIRTQMEG